MNAQLTVDECKVMWVVGAAERLATLGMLSPDVPLKLSQDAISDYLEIDEYRDHLFESDFEITQIFKALAESENNEEVDPEDINSVIDLILEYKNNRTELVKYALSNQV